MIIPQKSENVLSTVIKLLDIAFRPRETVVPLAEENYTKMFFPALFEIGGNEQKPKGPQIRNE